MCFYYADVIIFLQLVAKERRLHLHHKPKECWWFIITGQESILVKLDQEWSQVAIQTKWKLQNCFAPETESLQSQPQPAQIPQTDVSAQQTPCENSSDNLAGYASTTHPPALNKSGEPATETQLHFLDPSPTNSSPP